MQESSIVVGAREVATVLIAVAVLIATAALFVFALNQLPQNELQAEGPITPETRAFFVTATPFEATTTPDPLVVPTESTGPVIHTVLAGESAASIAALYNVNLFDLLTANDLTEDDIIMEGQELTIPESPDGPITFHEVRFGETLSSIADLYGVAPQVIQDANSLDNPDALIAGQELRIPGVDGPRERPTPTPAPTPEDTDGPWLVDWPRSLLAGDLAGNYPLTHTHERFTLHYQPGTYTDLNFEAVLPELDSAFAEVEDTLDVRMEQRFDIYIAGTLFESPNAHLRGLSGRNLDLFLLIDGSGDDYDNRYLYMHEMAHMVSRNTWGDPSSTMLSEGVATWVGQSALEAGDYLSYEQLCLAAYEAGVLPSMVSIERDWQQFEGHIRHRFSYFGSGCFIAWLVDEYGVDSLARLYPTSNYVGVYGQSLAQLNADWTATLDESLDALEANPKAIVDYTEEVRQAYAYVLPLYDGRLTMHRAYAAVDRARLALWQADYETAREALDEVYEITGFEPEG